MTNRILRKYFSVLWIMVFSLLGFPVNIGADILEISAIGTKGLGMASAVIALPTDAISALYYNPAGLTGLEKTSVEAGFLGAKLFFNYKNPATGYDADNKFIPKVPYFGFSNPVNETVTWGIGAYSTMGTGFEYKSDPAHGVTGDIKSVAGLVSVNPSIAYRITPDLSLGMQLNIGYCKAEQKMPIPGLGYLRLEADGFGLGTTVGILYRLTGKWDLGITYKSRMKTDLEGDAYIGAGREDIDLAFYWPHAFALGLGYRPVPKLSIGLTAKWTEWSHFDKSNYSYATHTMLNGPLTQDSENRIRSAIGVEYILSDKYLLRGGYFYSPSAIRTQDISPVLPDMTWHDFHAGAVANWDNWKMEMSFQYGYFESMTLSPAENPLFPGEYSGTMVAAGITWGYYW